MLNEELKDQILQTKLTYLNGYLDSLAIINSYSVIGMKYKLYSFSFSAGDIEKSIQNNAYELFGVYPNDWAIELIKIENWKEKLETELYKPCESLKPEDEATNEIKNRIKKSIRYFTHLFKNEFETSFKNVYEMQIRKAEFYKIVGIDLVFEIDDTKILFLQIIGVD